MSDNNSCRHCGRWAKLDAFDLCSTCRKQERANRRHAQVDNQPLPGYTNRLPRGLGTVVRTLRRLDRAR